MDKSFRNYLIFAVGLIIVFLVDGWTGAKKEDCIKMQKGLVQLPATGMIVLESQSEGAPSMIADLGSGKITELTGLMPFTLVGPYHGKLVYFDGNSGSWLLITMAGGISEILLKEEIATTDDYEAAVDLTPIALQADEKVLAVKPDGSLWLIDQVSKEAHAFAFTDQDASFNRGSSLDWGRYSLARIVPSQDMHYAIYPANGEPGMLLKLRDMETGEDLNQIHWGDTLSAPQWSPDGSSILTSAPPFIFYEDVLYTNFYDKLTYVGGNDLVAVGVNGEVRRLTTFSSRNIAVQSGYRWSPNGNKVAFLLETRDSKGKEKNSYLSILDIQTGENKLFCYPDDVLEAYQPLVWSPINNYLAFTMSTQSSTVPSTYMLDIANGDIIEAYYGLKAVGWE